MLIKHLGLLLDEQLLFKDFINALKQKLNRANGILAKLRHHFPSDIYVLFGNKATVTK